MTRRRTIREGGGLGASAQLALALGEPDTVVAARIDGDEAQLFRCPTAAEIDSDGSVSATSTGLTGFFSDLGRGAESVRDLRARPEDVAAGFVVSVVATVTELHALPRDTAVTVLHPASLPPAAVDALRDGLDHWGFVGTLRPASSPMPEIAARSALTAQPRSSRSAGRRRAPAPTRAAVAAAAAALVVLIGGATAATHLEQSRDVEPAGARDVVPPVDTSPVDDGAEVGTTDSTAPTTQPGLVPEPAPDAAPEETPEPQESTIVPAPLGPTDVPAPVVPDVPELPALPDTQWPPLTLPELPDLPEFPLPIPRTPAPSSSAAPTTTSAPATTTSRVTATP